MSVAKLEAGSASELAVPESDKRHPDSLGDGNKMNDSAVPAETTPVAFRTRVLKASGWTLFGHAGTQVLRFVSNLIMTRLLLPQMFGIMALANVLLTALSLISDIGLSQGVIQSKRGANTAYLNTAWTAQIMRGVLIWGAALLIAAALKVGDVFHLLAAGTAYAEPQLPALVAGISFNGLLGGLVSTRVASANRNLALGRISLIDVYCQFIAIAVMVPWALLSPSAWALVGGSIVSSVARVALSHTFVPGESNRLHWDWDAFREIFSFGKWIFVTSALGFLASNGDRLVLGGLVDAKTLGIYVIAAFMVTAIGQIFYRITSSVAFPAFSEIVRQDPQDLRRRYYQFRVPLDISSLFLTGLLYSAGHLIVHVLYNHRYDEAGYMLQILSISLFEIRFELVNSCMLALGKPRLLGPVISIQAAVIFILLPPVYRAYGIHAALWVITAAALCRMLATFVIKLSHGLFDLRRELLFLPLLPLGYFSGVALDALAHVAGFLR